MALFPIFGDSDIRQLLRYISADVASDSDYGWASVSTELERRARNGSRFVRAHPERIK
jgi:hypothetical protein